MLAAYRHKTNASFVKNVRFIAHGASLKKLNRDLRNIVTRK